MKIVLAALLAFLALNTAWAADPFDRVGPIHEATYSAGSTAVVPPATPTDICTITGSATKTVKVTRVEVSSTQTTAGINSWFLVKRSAANTGGTASGTFTRVPHDSAQGAATATTLAYTANPAGLGALVGIVRVAHLLSPAPGGTTAPNQLWNFDGGDWFDKPIFLRGITEVLAINFNGAALPTGLSVNCNFQWVEF